MTGTWEGMVVEEGRSDYYHVSITINSVNKGEIAGTVWYKDYNCGGNLIYLGLTNNGINYFREKLTTKGSCIDNGYIYALMKDGGFSYLWAHEQYDHQAKGFLNSRY